jgi:hypothetical protein
VAHSMEVRQFLVRHDFKLRGACPCNCHRHRCLTGHMSAVHLYWVRHQARECMWVHMGAHPHTMCLHNPVVALLCCLDCSC